MKKLYDAVAASSPLCVGIDPQWDLIPETLDGKYKLKERLSKNAAAYVYSIFCSEALNLLAPYVKVVKFQSAYFEAVGPQGLYTLQSLIREAKKLGYYVILDAKRSDISTTATAYAQAAFDIYEADALTVIPFMGKESVNAFVDYARNKGNDIFLLTKPTETSFYADPYLTLDMAFNLGKDDESGYKDIGGVVSGLFQHNNFRKHFPSIFFLVPGLGFQGGKIVDQLSLFRDGNGVILNYSRSILYYGDGIWEERIINNVKSIINEINKIILVNI